MKDIIRILYHRDIRVDLDGEKLKYVIVQNNDGLYQINYAPNNLKGTFHILNNFLCYDYDELSIYNQMRYERYYIELKRVNVNVYSKQEKTYKRTRESFT